ncbi:hypothetical protein H072_8669 [Dactylellina haptotyla CBS 200.50]|uniref:Spindle pole body-associated protein cut12 domain-containing protein n=1 Tax=Dactylellina haptotyla (strain CBS 200.50) TaxID=1284197 RepID=S8A4C8_DACHA|nr:hypothetical protein H072_8669 [Dactylellina haptotyla CBS 200.50]
MPQNSSSGGRFFGFFGGNERDDDAEGVINLSGEDDSNYMNHSDYNYGYYGYYDGGSPNRGSNNTSLASASASSGGGGGLSLQLDVSAYLEITLPQLMGPQQQHEESKQQHPEPQQPKSKQQPAGPSLLAIPHHAHAQPHPSFLTSPYGSESPVESPNSQLESPISPSPSPSPIEQVEVQELQELQNIQEQKQEQEQQEDHVLDGLDFEESEDSNSIRSNPYSPRDLDFGGDTPQEYAFSNMLAWLRGDQQSGEEEDIDQDLIIPDQDQIEEPETPGPTAFAFNAFRTGLFGTPKPNLEIHERVPRPKYGRDAMSDEDVFTSSRKRPESRSPGRFKTFEDVMTPPRKNPQSILVTPGNTISKKKTVSFGPDQFHEDTICYEARTGRVRSGLPAGYPGKFPSPWTPKITNDLPKRRTRDSRNEEIEIFEDQNKPVRATQKSKLRNEMTKTKEDISVDDQIQALRENTARINDMIEEVGEETTQEADVTVNLDEPRSRSGVYWKERYSSDLGQAEKKVEFYKARKDTSVDFASKKDEQAAHLATRLKEEIELRKKMQAEIDKWQKLAMEARPDPSTTVNAPLTETYQQKTIERLRRETAEYRDIIRQKEVEMNDHEYQLDRQRSEIERQARRIKELESSFKAKKEAAEEVSIYNNNAESEIRNLKRELRKAENAAAGKDLITAKFETSQREVERLKQQLSLVKEENIRLKVQQKSVNALPLDEITTVSTKESRPVSQHKLKLEPEEDIWQSLSGVNAHKDKPRNRSPKITEHSAFPRINLVDPKIQLGGIFSKPATTPFSKHGDTIPTIDEYLKQDDSDSTLSGQPEPVITVIKQEPVTKSTPNPRKSFVATPIMSEKEIMLQLENTDLSLPPISPTMASMSDTDLDKLKLVTKPLPRMSREDLAKSFNLAAAKPREPLDFDSLHTGPMPDIATLPKYETDEERYTLRKSATSPMPKYFNFEKSPNPRRGSFASFRSLVSTKPTTALDISKGISLKTTAAIAAPVVATGVGITTKTSPGSDTDAKRKLAAAKMAEMKARMKAAKKEAKA